MFILKKIACRIFQTGFRIAMPILPYREPKTISSLKEIDSVFTKASTKSAMVITDKGVLDNGLAKPLEKALKDSNIRYVIYDKTEPNPTVENVEEALLIYNKNHCDTLIAIGGGSPMDTAKAVGARVVYPKKTLNKLGGKLHVLRKLPTLIAVPTTAGTGSEVTLAALITDSKTHHKYAIMSFPLIPHYAVLDATLTYTLPPHLTATTGIDALTHAVESYIGRSTSKETRCLALEATKLIFENIEKAYTTPCDYTARENMLHAAYKAGIAFSKSYVGYIHAMSHALGGRYGIPHGLANAVIMPYLLEEYGESIYKKLHKLGIAAGVCSYEDTHKDAAEKFITAIKELNARLNIPAKIDGIKKEDIPSLARHAEKEANPLYPVPRLYTQKEIEKFFCRIGENL
ncbi:MAG: iron-containing alcohol dehydrogenase [Clostridia bacterium]|nr:iron-containing alcohol dehydrogenase [Clostridia bacterium]